MKKLNLAWCCAIATIIISIASPTSQQCFSANDFVLASVNNVFQNSTDFAIQLLKSITETAPGPSENIFFSPISIWSALMVAYLGAKGNTELQLSQSLGIGNANKGAVANTFLIEQQHYNNRNAKYTFRLVNKLIFDQKEPIRECIQRLLRSEIERVNFTGNAEAVRVSINKWIEAQTNNKIRYLLPVGSVNANTLMIIVNAAYFKGFWEHPFDSNRTATGDFFIQPHQIQTAELMFQEEIFPFAFDANLNCTAVELPYLGQEITMVILLPNDDSTVENLVLQLSTHSLENLFMQMSPQLVHLTIPKFKTEQSIKLEDIIFKLGIIDIFNPLKADLSGFTDQANTYIQSVRHKAYVEVDEKGTEAAAATSFITTKSFLQSAEFLVNKPFLFLIRHKARNTILFMGLIRNPTQHDP